MDKILKLPKEFKIREAVAEDLSAIVNIYNAVISEGGYTADLTSFTVKSKKEWFISLKKKKNIFIMTRHNIPLGYFYFSPWREGRDALNSTVELSFYIEKNYRGQGLGNLILRDALQKAAKKNLKYLLAILLDINAASVGLLRKFGFEIRGHLPGIAQLKDKECGQYLMLRKL